MSHTTPPSPAQLLRKAAAELESAATHYTSAINCQGQAVAALADLYDAAIDPPQDDDGTGAATFTVLARLIEGAELLQVPSDAAAQASARAAALQLMEVAVAARKAADALEKAREVLQ